MGRSITDRSTPAQRFIQRHVNVAERSGQATPECFNQVAFETPSSVKRPFRRAGSMDSVEGSQDHQEDSSAMTVAVRVRPFSKRSVSLF